LRQVSCGSSHTLAVTVEGTVYSWGCGGGGRLGHGDLRDRFAPTVVEGLRGSLVTTVAAGFWHSAALVAVPPLTRGRLVREMMAASGLGLI
jgi:alpha-tubulin suppressor-like RCC1 family protein